MNYRYHDITIEEYLKKPEDYSLIDVRSPSEYNEDHLPLAINIPILDDEERKIIGIIFKEEGIKAAKLKGREILFPKLNKILDTYAIIREEEGKAFLLYCARGGDRSKIMATILALECNNVLRLQGGYKEFRKKIVNFFAEGFFPQIHVLYGGTGTGKTHILNGLAKKDVPVIDLEGLAVHRGSVFGHIGLKPQVTQKRFETLLFQAISGIKENYVIVEGESKKIGRLHIPERFFKGMLEGIHYLISGSIEARVERLIIEYGGTIKEHREETRKALVYLTVRLGHQKVKILEEYLDSNSLDLFLKELLNEYYDPLYEKNRAVKEYTAYFNSDDLEKCIEEIRIQFLEGGLK